MAQPLPIQSWKSTLPWVVSAVKFGASLLMRSDMARLRWLRLDDRMVGRAPSESGESCARSVFPQIGVDLGAAWRRAGGAVNLRGGQGYNVGILPPAAACFERWQGFAPAIVRRKLWQMP